nr:T7SS effector LXG polymorphic toxin [Bacillus safensis]
MLDAKALTSAMDTRAKHYQELREQMVDLKKALQGVANLGDDFTGKGSCSLSLVSDFNILPFCIG